MQDKYEINSKTSLDNEIEENNKTITGLILKLKRSTKAFTVLQDQNKELQRHVDALIKLDMDNNKDVVEMFENYEKNAKKLQIDNECLNFQIKAYHGILKNKNIDAEKDSVTCIICCDQLRNVIFRPCNHILICDDCSGKTNYVECFACRSEIVEYEYAYLI